MKPPSSFQVLCFIAIALISSVALPFAILANGSRQQIDAGHIKIEARLIAPVAVETIATSAADVATAAAPVVAAVTPAAIAAAPAVTAATPAVTAAAPVDTSIDTIAAADAPNKFVIASADPLQMLPKTSGSAMEATPEEATPEEAVPDDAMPGPPPLAAMPPVSAIEGPEDCLLAQVCIDQYLWAFYQRTPKQDTNKVHERRKVTVKRKGKTRTVTKVFTKLVDADFTWKDPHAAEKAHMPLMTYVIGGMDREFKRNLLYMLMAAEREGLSPGITSGFRDDYRQAIASGQKAASNRSFHGGSLRGGYGHGLAADVVSVIGKTRSSRWYHSERFWNWIDANGSKFGIGRPYLNKDAPHVGPIEGREYAAQAWRRAAQLAAAERKQRLAAAKSAKLAKSNNKKDNSKTATASTAKPLQKSAEATPAKKGSGK
jgi:hypothetical protein